MSDSGNPAGPDGGDRRYYPYSRFVRETFGTRVHKISLDAGLGCPNRDGTIGTGGCIYCDEASFSPSRRGPRLSLPEQLEVGIRRVGRISKAEQFIAYFQPGTNTYAPLERLREVYCQALEHPQVVGLAVSTRPDCVTGEVLDLLAELAERVHVSIEFGLQSSHEETLRRLNRGHDAAAFGDAVARARQRGLDVVAHVILGLPGEDEAAMWATARELGAIGPIGVKMHSLYVARGTPLAEMYQRGRVRLLDLDQYVHVAVGYLERLHPRSVIHRFSGNAPPEYLVAPEWCLDKARVRAMIEAELKRRDTRQGARHAAAAVG